MEANPSPQSIGREFVKQFYSLFNQAPGHLHSFYNKDSSFVLKGLDSNNKSISAIGQKQIQQKIQQLNFRDVRTKINNIYSLPTLSNGVVVQVSGEFSNAGQPMRPFTQTFVLILRAPKKYFISNDIFQYQDDIPDKETFVCDVAGGINKICEKDAEESGPSEPDNSGHQNQGQTFSGDAPIVEPLIQPVLIPTQQQQIYYAQPPQLLLHPVMKQVFIRTVHTETPLIDQQQLQPQPQPQPQQQTSLPPLVQQTQQQQQLQPNQYVAEPTAQIQLAHKTKPDTVAKQPTSTETKLQAQPTKLQEEKKPETATTDEFKPERQVLLNAATNISSTAPKSYASVAKLLPSLNSTPRLQVRKKVSTGSAGSTATLSGMNVRASQQQTLKTAGSQQPHQSQHQQQKPSRGCLVQRDGNKCGGTRPCKYSNAHKLFLGNLPHNTSEQNLRQLFERYGKVADLRIHSRVHSKSSDKCKSPLNSNNTATIPNYGFITFEDQKVVTKVLNSLPIYYPDKHGQKVNVQKIIVKHKMPMDGSKRRLNSGDGNKRPTGGQQQQQRGPFRSSQIEENFKCCDSTYRPGSKAAH